MDAMPADASSSRERSTDSALLALYPMDDLTQECIVRIARKLPTCDSISNPTAWARAVAHNLCRTLYRRERSLELRHVALDECGEIPGSRSAPADDCERRARRASLDAAIDALPEQEGAAVRHVHLEGLTCREAAALMQRREGSVRKAVARGLGKLAEDPGLVVWMDGGMGSATRGGAPRDGEHPVLALEVDRAARRRLADGLRLGATDRILDGVRFASGWRELDRLAHRLPGCPVVADPACPARDRPGVDALRLLRAHNPDAPVIGYGRAGSSWQDAGLVREIGFVAVVSIGVDDHAAALRDTLLRAADCEETEALLRRVKERAAPDAHRFLDVALHESVTRRTVACVARKLGIGERELARRCRAGGLPTPKRLMLLAATFHIERLSRWSGRSQRATAMAVGVRRASDYGRIVRRLFGTGPSGLARLGGPDHVADVIVREVRI